MPTPEEKIAILQRYVDRYAADATSVLGTLADETMPAPARRLVVGALNYVLDLLDMFPDHYLGLGVADDAIVLRLAAAQAVAAGAHNATLTALAADAPEIGELFPSVTAALERFVGALPDRTVHGRNADRILSDADVRVSFEVEIGRQIQRHRAGAIGAQTGDPVTILGELEKMIRHGLKRAGQSV
jgi:uncharacterized membrane protein YkvA (DUF1232 family)